MHSTVALLLLEWSIHIYLLLHNSWKFVFLVFDFADLIVSTVVSHAFFQLFDCLEGCLSLLRHSTTAFSGLHDVKHGWRWLLSNGKWKVVLVWFLRLEGMSNINWLCILNLLADMKAILLGSLVSLNLVDVVQFVRLNPYLRSIKCIIAFKHVVLFKSYWTISAISSFHQWIPSYHHFLPS